MNKLKYLTIFLLACTGCTNQIKSPDEHKDSSDTSSWKILGPGGGGGVFLPTVSPFNKDLVLTHCDMTGAYISHNGGTDWRMFNLWTVPNDFEFDPLDSNVIYTATHGYRYSEDRGSGLSMLYRSEDKGKHWRIIYPDVSKIKTDAHHLQNEDLLPSEIAEGAFDGTIEKVEVDPLDNKNIYMGLSLLKSLMDRDNKDHASDYTLLVLSTDYGKTWKKIADVPGQHVKAIFPGSASNHPGEVLVFTESSSALVNENTGSIKMQPLPAQQLIVVEGGKNMIYAQCRFNNQNGEIKGGMFVSRDWGGHWVQANTGLLNHLAGKTLPSFPRALAVCETRPETAYVSTVSQMLTDKNTSEETFCIFKTANGGTSWEPVLLSSSERGYITGNYEGSWLDRSYGAGWGGSPFCLGVAPQDPDVCFAGDNGRCYKTNDGGKSWKQAYSHTLPDSSYASNGLDVTTCYGIHFDPFNKDHFFICYTDIGLFHTFNGGASWLHSVTNIPNDLQNTCYDLVFDPKTKGRIWSVWANAHDLPRDKMFGGSGFGRYSGGVAVSTDEGHTWQMSSKGLPENAICTNILLDPSDNSGSETLYVSVFDQGVYKSSDGGRNWEKKNDGFGGNLFAWQLRRNAKGRIFVLFARGKKEDKPIDGGIYYTDDGAATWKRLLLPQGVSGPHDLLIDSLHPDIMYVSCWPASVNGHDAFGGVIKTEDGGLTWKQVFDSAIRVNSAAADPAHPGSILINTFQNAAYHSEDAGNTWKKIGGYRFKWGQRIIPDPYHDGMVYLTTYGGSVFYGPLKEQRNSSIDIENMPKDWW